MANLYVGNFPFSTQEHDLQNFFEGIGEITNIKLILDRDTGRPRGFGFITFADEACIQMAIDKHNGEDFNGRPLRLDRAEQRQNRGGDGGFGGGRGGFRGGRGGGFGGGRGGGFGQRGPRNFDNQGGYGQQGGYGNQGGYGGGYQQY